MAEERDQLSLRRAGRVGESAAADQRAGIAPSADEVASTHLLVDLRGAQCLDDVERVEAALRQSVQAIGATLLHIYVHRFSRGGGVSGIAVLAESHISIHTWPEHQYAAIDIFVCGRVQPEGAVPLFEEAFHPTSVEVNQYTRRHLP